MSSSEKTTSTIALAGAFSMFSLLAWLNKNQRKRELEDRIKNNNNNELRSSNESNTTTTTLSSSGNRILKRDSSSSLLRKSMQQPLVQNAILPNPALDEHQHTFVEVAPTTKQSLFTLFSVNDVYAMESIDGKKQGDVEKNEKEFFFF